MQKLIITAQGGTRFTAHLLTAGDRLGDFLGSMEFGTIDSDGQYEQDVDEIIDAARNAFSIDATVPVVVR